VSVSDGVTPTHNGSISATYVVNVLDTTPPSNPSGLVASQTQQRKVQLRWNASTDNVGVVKYNVRRGSVQIAQSTTASYLDSGVSAGATYNYTVTAVDAAAILQRQAAQQPYGVQERQAVAAF